MIPPKVVHESNTISSIIQLVKNGLGISIVLTNVIKSYENAELELVELKQSNLFTDILIATSKNRNSEIADAATAFLLK
ncbi:LysR family transcriptional regulator substrate-binding protein [Flavobacterium sp. TAB 87]|uniref:LysR family transcriptional regulator substrate-binding protein n=1 Tax=Flavobacterium sp. TAB 87 TaxID=1729581 RepID=UPI00082FA2A4|nr:LysR family transcriptional regulator substrate-binding protein [Flavobacterium sp. TAB 87]